MKIRLANSGDGDRLKELVECPGDFDWSDIYPYWIVAEKEGIVGCMSIALCKPIGYLDQLHIDSSLGPHARARALRELTIHGMAVLRADGASAVISMVPFENRATKRALKKHFGAVALTQGNILMARL